MRGQRNEEVNKIMRDRVNKIFFDNATFHGDKGYKIIEQKNGRKLFVVTTGHGLAYYELNGTIIGDFVPVDEL